MSSEPSLASCGSGFSWMKNDEGQDPCTIAAWLIILCQNPNNTQPASIAPLTSTSYSAPNGTSANSCTCSWAFYNNIEACTICQGFLAEDYSSWSSSCAVLGQTSNTTYWQASVSFSQRTELPRWSIVDPSKWSLGTFNTTQAEEIADQNLPDVTDTSAGQPSVSSSPSETTSSGNGTRGKTDVGAIAGGVVAGVVVVALATILWFFLCKRHRKLRKRGARRHVDLDADPDEGGILGSPGDVSPTSGNPLAAHLHSQSLDNYAGSPTSPVQQMMFEGHPLLGPQTRSNTSPPALTNNQGQERGNVVVGVTRTSRMSRDSIPTVAEQLDEKKRLRTEQQRQNRRDPPSSRRNPPTGYAGTVTQTGSSSRSTGTDDLQYSGGNDTAPINQAASRSLSHSHSASQSQLMGTEKTDLGDEGGKTSAGNRRSSRRFSLKKAGRWNYRRRQATVMNVGSDVGSNDGDHDEPTRALGVPVAANTHSNAAPLPLGGTVASAGQTTTASEVMAAVPGARLPNARERENPPPEYT